MKNEFQLVAWAAYEALTAQRAQDAKGIAEGEARQKALLTEAVAWQSAQQIRSYTTHVLSMGGQQKTQALLDWGKWAHGIADGLDPAISRLEGLSMDQRNRTV